MSVYIYRTSPNALATIEIEWRDGHRSIEQVSLYSYLGKPGWSDDSPYTKACDRLVRLAHGQFRKAGPHRQPCELGVLTYQKGFNVGVAGSPVANVHNCVTVYDDCLASVGKVVRVISLPRGYKATSPSESFRNALLNGIPQRAQVGRSNYDNGKLHEYTVEVIDGWFHFASDDGQTHRLSVSETDDARLWAHWNGFAYGRLPR